MQNNKKQEKHTKLSIFISLILRHKPDVVGLCLSNEGWLNVNDLIEAINNKSEYRITREILDEIVATDNKGRYSYNDDKTLIRANQGHSIKGINVEMKECKPPKILYHGTSTKNLISIAECDYIKSMSRLHVHLSSDYDTALNVGKRHGEPVVLTIDAEAMYKDGYKFYLSTNGVWLTNSIPFDKYVIK